jgi:5-methylcytosine-specific restriction endonuclease McrA
MALVRRCLRCGRLSPGSYCPAHARPLGSTYRWAKVREQILARDRFTCQECDAPAHDVEHVIPRAYGGTETAPELAGSQRRLQPRQASQIRHRRDERRHG